MTPKQILLAKRTLAITSVAVVINCILFAVLRNFPISLAATIPVTYLCWLWWRIQLQDVFRIKKFACVIPGKLYRSGQIAPYWIARTLKKHHIHTVVDLTKKTPVTHAHQLAEQRAIASLNINGQRFEMEGDGTGPISAVSGAVATIHRAQEKGQPVLVHCAAGVQRTGHVVAAYLLLVAKADPEKVFQHLEDCGWLKEKDSRWLRQLNQRMESLASLLQQQGVLDQIPSPLPLLTEDRPQTTGSFRRKNITF